MPTALDLGKEPDENDAAPPKQYKPGWLERFSAWIDDHGEGLLWLLFWWRPDRDSKDEWEDW